MAPRSAERQSTPPSRHQNLAVSGSRHSRSPAVDRHSPSSASPASVKTPTDTSPITGGKRSAPALLPRVRKQDQTLDPIIVPQHRSLRTSARSPRHGRLPSVQHHQHETPPESSLLTPISAASHSSHDNRAEDIPPRLDAAFTGGQNRPAPLPLVRAGVRSSPSIPNSASTHGYQYTFQTPRFPYNASTTNISPDLHDGRPHSSTYPSTLPVPTLHSYQSPNVTSPQSPLAWDQNPRGTPATTLRTYLTAKIQPPSLVPLPTHSHVETGPFWWEVRNLRRWDSFTMHGIHQIPGLRGLLDVPLPEPSLPRPGVFHSQPESLLDLHNLYDRIFSVKITEALKASGVPHLAMSSQRSSDRPGAPSDVPDFIAKYPLDMEPSETEPTAFAYYPAQPCDRRCDSDAAERHPKARVIGLVRRYYDWNSGMRGGGVTHRTNYMRGLAQLHQYMRDNRCRYGYIITEIELVCVRMGTQPSDAWPIFGLLELSDPIPLAAHASPHAMPESSNDHSRSRSSSGGSAHASRESKRLSRAAERTEPADEGVLTVALALWYLHMLARQTPFIGQPPSKVTIGMPHELSRQNVIPRDKGFIGDIVPEPREKRIAKMSRGWIEPDDPLAPNEKLHKRWTKKKEEAWQELQRRHFAPYVQAMAQAEAAAYYNSIHGHYTNGY